MWEVNGCFWFEGKICLFHLLSPPVHTIMLFILPQRISFQSSFFLSLRHGTTPSRNFSGFNDLASHYDALGSLQLPATVTLRFRVVARSAKITPLFDATCLPVQTALSEMCGCEVKCSGSEVWICACLDGFHCSRDSKAASPWATCPSTVGKHSTAVAHANPLIS